MVVVFGPSDVPGIWPFFLRQLGIVLDAAARSNDWFVVVKPKGSDRLYAEAEKYPDLARRMQNEHAIFVRYPIPGREVCSTGYLMDKMTLGVSLGGSVMAEALCRNRAVMAFYPVSGETPLRQKLLELGLLHTTEGSFQAALNAFMADPAVKIKILPFAWFKERFDPFGDARVLDRFAAALYPTPSDAAMPPAKRAAP